MKTRIIYTKIWKDEYFASLKVKEKLLFVYLITNERVNLTGIYELSDREIKFDLSLTEKEIEQAKEKFINDEKFLFKNSWVKITNYEKYNNYSGALNETAKERELLTIPQEIQELQYPIDSVSGISNTLNNHKSEIRNKKQEIRKELISSEQIDSVVAIMIKRGAEEEAIRNEIHKFVDYWTEKNHTGTKERWQMQKTFEVKKRLATWFNNVNKFSGRSNDKIIIG